MPPQVVVKLVIDATAILRLQELAVLRYRLSVLGGYEISSSHAQLSPVPNRTERVDYCPGMAFAAGRALDATFVRRLARDREEYAMPPRLHELAERFAKRTLALLFPHFAAEVGGRAGDVAEELALLEKELADVLRLPETHCSSPDAVLERFLR